MVSTKAAVFTFKKFEQHSD